MNTWCCVLGCGRVLAGLKSALPPIIYGWVTFLLVLTAVFGTVKLTSQSSSLAVIIGRFIASGVILLVWLYSWWMFILYYKKRVMSKGYDEHGG